MIWGSGCGPAAAAGGCTIWGPGPEDCLVTRISLDQFGSEVFWQKQGVFGGLLFNACTVR